MTTERQQNSSEDERSRYTSILKQLYSSEGYPISKSIIRQITKGKYSKVLIGGIPGIGKSHICDALQFALNEKGVKVDRITQDQFFKRYKQKFGERVLEWRDEEYMEMLYAMQAEIEMEIPDKVKSQSNPTIVLAEIVGVTDQWTEFMKHFAAQKDTFIIFVAGDLLTLELSENLRPEVATSDPAKAEEILKRANVYTYGIDDLTSNERERVIYDTIKQSAPPVTISYFKNFVISSAKHWATARLYTESMFKEEEMLPETFQKKKRLKGPQKYFLKLQLTLYDLIFAEIGLQNQADLAEVWEGSPVNGLIIVNLFTDNPKYFVPKKHEG